MKRVVVTGLGALTPIGNDVDTYWKNLVTGKSGAARITHFNPEKFKTQFACELKDFNVADHLEKGDIRKADPFTQYAYIVADQAVKDSGLDFSKMNPFDAGVIWGSGQGGMFTFEEQMKEYVKGDSTLRFNPYFLPKFLINMASGMISIKYGLMGINYTTVSACASSNSALMDALNYIRFGKAKVMITGGSESGITEASIGGFSALKALSVRNDDPASASRPFDKDRDGFVMGEGAAALILEEYEHAKARGAKIYAELAGASMTADAYHMTSTHPEGTGALHAMKFALNDAGINAEEVDHLNMHATSTPVGDISEANAVAGFFQNSLSKLHISATKSMTGHLLGAAGAIEAVACVKSIQDNIIPPVTGTTTIDEKIPTSLQIVLKEARQTQVKVAMSNNFGFGGHNGIVVFKQLL